MKKNPMTLVIVIAVIACALSFYGGTIVGGGNPSLNSGRFNFGTNDTFRNGNGRQGQGGGNFINGEIIKQDATSITVKMRDGTSRIVFLSGTATVQKMVAGSASDLQMGEQVMVTGKQNSDGTIVADSVQVRPPIQNVNMNTNVNNNGG